jgi:hypothetical protein
MMRPAAVVVSCLVSFGGTIALLLYDPDAALVVLAAVALCLVIVPFVRIDLMPWLVTPPLAALTLWSLSAPGGYVLAIAGVALCAVLYGIVLLVRLTALRSRMPLTTVARRAWRASVVVGVVAAVVAVTTIPLELRFRLSEDAMTRTAREVLAGKRDPAAIARIGLWNVRRAERLPGGMLFLVEDAGFFDSHGFLYPTDGLPPPGARYYGGGWYLVTEDFEL